MSDSHLSELEALWEELNQSDDVRQQRELEARLQQRAQQYAAPQLDKLNFSDDDIYRLLVFSLGSERYGVDVTAIRGVRPVGSITRVPAVPPFYRGVVNVRGRIVSALDLRYFFNINTDASHIPKEMLLVESGELFLALLADHIEEVMTIPRVAVEPVEMSYARGVTMGRLVILDIKSLFADERLILGGGDNK